MIEVLKKRHAIGDYVTIHTSEASFSGEISAFEDTCIILETPENIEVISYSTITRFTVSKSPLINTTAVDEEVKANLNTLDAEPKVLNNKFILSTTSVENLFDKESLETDLDKPKIGLKIVGKIDLDQVQYKKSSFSLRESSYRLSRVSRELSLTTKDLVKYLKQLGIEAEASSSFRITEAEYNALKEKVEKERIQPVRKKESIDLLGIKVNSLEHLNQIKERIVIEEGKQLIAANAIIKRYSIIRDYGFITDSENIDYYFKKSSILDPDLTRLLSVDGNEGIHIVSKLIKERGKFHSINLCLPNSIEHFFLIAQNLYNNKDFDGCSNIVDLILQTKLDYEPAVLLRQKIQNKRKASFSVVSAEEAYIQAKKEIKKGNINKAKELLYLSLDLKDYRSESALKELSYILQREGQINEAITLIKDNSHKIKASDPNSLIAYFYETKKEHKIALEYLNKIKYKTSIELLKINKRKAFAFFWLKDYPNAINLLKLVLSEQPDDFHSHKLLEGLSKIKEKGITEELEAIFNEAELASLSGGQSPFIQFSLEKCTFSGVPSTILSQEKFTNATLRELRKLIEGAGKARPKERAGYLLTEAKLMSMIEPEKEREMNGVLTRYCLAISQNASIENSPTETIQFLFMEAFKLATDFDSISRYLPIYLESYFKSSFEAYKSISKPIDETLRETINEDSKEAFYLGLIDIFQTNTTIYSKLLTSIYKNEVSRTISYNYLYNYVKKERKAGFISKENFQLVWNESLEIRKRENSTFNNKVISIVEGKSFESVIESINQILATLPSWLNQQDRHRLKTVGELSSILSDFLNQKAFEDKERYYSLAVNQILQLNSEIEAYPTKLSFNSLRPVLEKLSNLIESAYVQLIETSKPELIISILGEGIVLEAESTVLTQYCISNKKGSAPISWLSLNIENTTEIKFIEQDNTLEQTLKGGDEKILRLSLKISERIQKEGATNIKITCFYKVRGSNEVNSIEDNLSLRLYSENEFERIENTFATTADSGPVMDDSMFFGRDEFIRNVTDSVMDSASKCIIIYGQKRSGKSSVLHHLKERLNKLENAFCISFSLGEIVEDLSALTFYYTVLNEIQDSLDDLRDYGIPAPNFIAPSLNDLKEAPSIVFNDSMKEFKKSMISYDGWQNKKLILLLDEFTYIYTAIQKKVLNDQFMKTWKSFLEKGHFSSVLIGQDIMPKFTEAYPNEFGVTEPKRLSYLNKEDAKKLIEQPIWDTNNSRSRFLGNAVELILDYTSSNPYYVQIFCARLVEYMNTKKIISVTEADILDIGQSFVKGEQSLSADKFDNLITAGDADLEANSPKDVLKALKEIAVASKNLDSCHRDSINLGNKKYEDNILSDLKSREVISCPAPNYYKINVRLFKEWLLNN